MNLWDDEPEAVLATKASTAKVNPKKNAQPPKPKATTVANASVNSRKNDRASKTTPASKVERKGRPSKVMKAALKVKKGPKIAKAAQNPKADQITKKQRCPEATLRDKSPKATAATTKVKASDENGLRGRKKPKTPTTTDASTNAMKTKSPKTAQATNTEMIEPETKTESNGCSQFIASLLRKSQLRATRRAPCPALPGCIRLGSDCTGIGTDYLALKAALLGTDVSVVFVADKDENKVRLLKKLHGMHSDSVIGHVYGDIVDRDVKSMPKVDLFVCGAPCPPWSSAGKGLGLNDPTGRGVVFFHSLDYVVAHRPRACVFENVKGLMFKKHAQVLNDIKAILRNCGYEVYVQLLDTREHGVPQSRPRIYIVAILTSCLNKDFQFSFPTPVPMTEIKQFLGAVSDDLEGCDVTEGLSGATLRNVMSALEKSAKLGKNPVDDWAVVDTCAGPTFAHVMFGCCPCLTKARGGQDGHYVIPLRRKLNIHEIGALQGIPKAWVDAMLEAVPDKPTVGRAIGDAMSLNVIMRLLPRVLVAAGLLDTLPPDVWAAPPPAGVRMPDYNIIKTKPVGVRRARFVPVWS
jgi:DNA-cytosine methyltransferase